MRGERDPANDQASHDSGNRNAAVGSGSEAHRIGSSDGAASPTDKGSIVMPDNKTDRGNADRSRVAGEQQYEVAYFARKHGLSPEEARSIISKAGPSRARADEMAAAR